MWKTERDKKTEEDTDAKSACYFYRKKRKGKKKVIIYDGHWDGHNEHLAIQYDAKICQGKKKEKEKKKRGKEEEKDVI